METTWRIGYALFLIPSQLVLADGRIPARIWLPACEVLWGICVGLMACMKNATGLYVCRFFLGVFGASRLFASMELVLPTSCLERCEKLTSSQPSLSDL